MNSSKILVLIFLGFIASISAQYNSCSAEGVCDDAGYTCVGNVCLQECDSGSCEAYQGIEQTCFEGICYATCGSENSDTCSQYANSLENSALACNEGLNICLPLVQQDGSDEENNGVEYCSSAENCEGENEICFDEGICGTACETNEQCAGDEGDPPSKCFKKGCYPECVNSSCTYLSKLFDLPAECQVEDGICLLKESKSDNSEEEGQGIPFCKTKEDCNGKEEICAEGICTSSCTKPEDCPSDEGEPIMTCFESSCMPSCLNNTCTHLSELFNLTAECNVESGICIFENPGSNHTESKNSQEVTNNQQISQTETVESSQNGTDSENSSGLRISVTFAIFFIILSIVV